MDENVVVLPVLPLRGMMVFPYMMVHLDAGREQSISALEKAMLVEDKHVFLVAQRDSDLEDPQMSDLYSVGTVAEIKHLMKLPDGAIRVLVEGLYRGQIVSAIEQEDDYLIANVREYHDKIDKSIEMEALVRVVVHEFEQWVKSSKKIPADAMVSVSIIDDAGRLADMIAGHINLKLDDRQAILESIDVKERLERLYGFLKREKDILDIERKIGTRVRRQIEKVQKEYYLREKVKAIHNELGDQNGILGDIEEYKERLSKGHFPDEVVKTVEKELKRLERTQGMSQEGAVIGTYIDNLLSMPWESLSEDINDIKAAAAVLDRDHYGLEKVKERILEFLAVRQLTNGQNAPILCLVGPPGVGKTSLAGSVAKALGRKFVRASLGGVRDEAEIRGHRRTYVGAMPGRILEALKKAGTRNPVFLLDEVDKMGSDYKGDPTSALLEVLDPAQNNTFSDHYIELPFNLSDVLWIVTANDIGSIPRPLLDRMEVINLSSYTEQEKLEIAKQYLLPRQRTRNGLSGKEIKLGAGVLQRMINEYTRESGVRELERVIGHLCRKVARKIVEGDTESVYVTTKNLVDILGKVKYPHTKAKRKPEVGLCTGMAWTQVGGDILPTEVNIFPGTGKLILTGKLGDVMKESAQAALSYIRSRQDKFELAEDFYEKNDIHVHFPEGAVPKDGPSAGITMATAIVSGLTGRRVRSDVAMTGEITIRGNVLAIGGLKEKVLAAYREGIRTIVLPKENERDIEDIPESVREKLEFVPVENMDKVLETALCQ
ncbi:MAG: endopeptidase La [Anaerovibrio sp.]|uniref:endopeptidase La n=1 Tax=Anaerovibrio TaxID=82373 RepID=UPI0023F30A1E|nr:MULTISPECIES: endopeptidase La [Anaerovibrio]MBQ2009576.1 endopeptidase La [Selenomonadaceae bacterium]MBQ2410461.1 endopeptidase La [Selenomonadaceae bacterium]MBQ5846009.1 endopeptidase La [Selenomonadaceae bacterium]MBQ5920210.1 endopeptidase La [Selenomonadaceae bacterium]MBR0329043.1 endopeptidase La [Selenomonadaceae bacterium]